MRGKRSHNTKTEKHLIHIDGLIKLIAAQANDLHQLATLKPIAEAADNPRRARRRLKREGQTPAP
jgi:hypothetical protein